MKLNLYCNKRAKIQTVDIIRISFFAHIEVHNFLCIGALFSVQKAAVTSGRDPFNLYRQTEQ
jgi:hypothetical protein